MAGARSLAEDLRGRTDAELAALLLDRPDLARPAPADVTALAARSTTRASLQRALDGLDLAHLQALEAVVVASPCSPAEVAGLLGTDEGHAAARLERLRHLALCWGSPEGYRATRSLAELVGPTPAGLGPRVLAGEGATSAGSPTDPGASPRVPVGDELEAALADVDPRGRTLLDALTWGPPTGQLSAGSPMRAVAAELVAAGLLRADGPDQVVLPQQVGLALRGGRLHRHPAPYPPAVDPAATVDPASVDAAAGGRAGDLIVLVTELVDRWGDRPPRVLRAGGLAVRDLTRLAEHLEIGVDQTAWLLETAAAADLVGVDEESARTEPVWAPTTEADLWLSAPAGARWARLARAWWLMPSAPALVGTSAHGRVNVLTTGTSYPLARQRRHDTLGALASLPPGSAPGVEELVELVRWRHPLRASRSTGDHGVGPDVALREAEWAGLTGRGALSSPGRLLVAGPPGADEPALIAAAAAAMEPHVPPAVDHVLLQADLTAIAPGRLDGPSRSLLHLVADVESRGGASVHRFTEESVRRALDAGWSADRLLTDLAEVSRTGVPQPLDYLVRDVARRHGQARVGSCAAYLRSDDPALLDRVEHDRALSLLQWRRIAPTVLVSPVPAATVLDLLREEQYGPLAEGSDGGVELLPQRARRASRRGTAPIRVSAVDEKLATAVVGLLRRGEAAREAGMAATGEGLDGPLERDPVVVTATLREAAAEGVAVWIGYADATGGVSTHLVRPLLVEAGQLRAVVGDGDVTRTFVVHRVTGVRPAGQP